MMNQTPAAILVLSASVLSFAATNANATLDRQAPTVLTLSAIGIGLWGILSLVGSVLRERESSSESQTRMALLDRFFLRENRPTEPSVRSTSHVSISPELQARHDLTAELEGRDRSEILEETLRLHLPKYTKRAA